VKKDYVTNSLFVLETTDIPSVVVGELMPRGKRVKERVSSGISNLVELFDDDEKKELKKCVEDPSFSKEQTQI
jgi:hypothetical protein